MFLRYGKELDVHKLSGNLPPSLATISF